ncbi:MAG: HAD hydrolase family protein, partial [Candidatus Thermoplasmatota archaeon]|nr:HAD hydrolase family protein [Candidatus Thermoplasmatota archaeon]
MTHLPRKPIRALIVDVDGTLTDRDRVLNFEVAKTLRMLSSRGLPIVMATGNVLPIALGLQRFLGLKGPIIADNGGMVYFSEERIVRLGSREVALRAYEKIR